MKKSNLLLIAAGIILLISLGFYNSALKAEYLAGSFKDPLRKFTALNLSGFEAIDNNAASKVQVTVKPGKFQVWVHERSLEFVKVKLVGKRLQIDADFPERAGFNEKVIITCPDIREISTNSFYLVKGKQNDGAEDQYYEPLRVEGFTLDSLNLKLERSSAVLLAGNKIGTLRARISPEANSGSKLEIAADNTIRDAYLRVHGKGRLVLNSPDISRLHPVYGDSASVTLTGNALGLLKK
ncbi:MAG: hypothetical protein ACO1NZ_13235 [Adhaeribacter sp.]